MWENTIITMTGRIITELNKLESAFAVKVLYACESGSRAWGFASADSDFDVRFLYAHPANEYVSIHDHRDVIELPIDDALDINGWDIRKALGLFYKSNPGLMEWLGSPIVYVDRFGIADKLRDLTQKYYSSSAAAHHYVHMAQRNYKDHLMGEEVWLKQYFYVLRPILAVNWIQQGCGVVPTEFRVLVNRIVQNPALREAIDKLTDLKSKGAELSRGPRIAVISEFIQSELARFTHLQIAEGPKVTDINELNEFFRSALETIWVK